ncbi:MAG: indolepyruvate oxidoreductase subunit beta [Bacteroidales bacterium]|jgi:indolepyruvate ferredoxin oxidoreductase, beta subunit|nr:indolepyruvate oxidoreductase subunit beta [Bacteroidales bacterium]MDD2204932.1 indolepyruvate oxidoreductase subunit beta [Bacteroidales bacterium]MDD3152652.1 indolepyruvate oxidoreductase subunit beta [Bacteroidales bacterium]MDD3914555.1 indolepyruvate oxidoreductase subunit beta [Bacteroidales bacterium]MDD4634449.1 indolepyruvate oxidoreductase subunit beta [Bacteroidales bacterium]
MKSDIILAGVGGQGILSIAATIGTAAVAEGLYLKQAEVHGMSQRGGDVQSHLRVSDSPIASDLIPAGKADLIISVEPMEALRYADMLSDSGWIITNISPFININNYPEPEAIYAEIKKIKNHVIIDADRIAKDLGTAKAANIVILGAAAKFIDMPFESFEKALKAIFGRKGDKVVEMNIAALHAGAKAADEYIG